MSRRNFPGPCIQGMDIFMGAWSTARVTIAGSTSVSQTLTFFTGPPNNSSYSYTLAGSATYTYDMEFPRIPYSATPPANETWFKYFGGNCCCPFEGRTYNASSLEYLIDFTTQTVSSGNVHASSSNVTQTITGQPPEQYRYFPPLITGSSNGLINFFARSARCDGAPLGSTEVANSNIASYLTAFFDSAYNYSSIGGSIYWSAFSPNYTTLIPWTGNNPLGTFSLNQTDSWTGHTGYGDGTSDLGYFNGSQTLTIIFS